MAYPRTLNDESPTPDRPVSTLRFTRRRDLRRRHNPNVDAAWWPRSSNLTLELAHLLQVAQEFGFRATHVAHRVDDEWTARSGQVVFDGRTVKVSGYHNHHPDMITLVDGRSHERLQVMVVPAATPPLLARRALRIATVYADPLEGSQLLALARGEARVVVTG